MGKIKVHKDGVELESDPFLTKMARPNPFQTQSQFLWDFMFWMMIGNDYTYSHSRLLDREDNKLYHLDPSKMRWPSNIQDVQDKMIFSDADIAKRNKTLIEYKYNDGQVEKLLLDRIIVSNDLTNGTGNWYKGSSRLDALYKVISNSESALDSKNINIRFASKFLVGSNNETNKMGLGETEKLDIETKFSDDNRKIYPLKTMVQIRRFVEDMKSLDLGTAYQEDFFIIGGLFGIPKDVLEAYLKSSTFENQEKARMAHVAYTLSPKGEQWMDSFERHFGYDKEGKNISITWDHLPMMGVFKKDQEETKKITIASLKELLALGVPLDEANAYLGLDFTIEEKEVEPIQESIEEPLNETL